MVKGETCMVKLLSRPIFFQSTVIKPYLRLELTKEPILYDAVKHVKPTRINESIPPL